MSESYDPNGENEVTDPAWLIAAEDWIQSEWYGDPKAQTFRIVKMGNVRLISKDTIEARFFGEYFDKYEQAWNERGEDLARIALYDLHERVHALLDPPKTVKDLLDRARPPLYGSPNPENGPLTVNFVERWVQVETPNDPDNPYHFERVLDVVPIPEPEPEPEPEIDLAKAAEIVRAAGYRVTR